MGLSGCYCVIKYILAFVNLIFGLIACATIVLSIWMLTDPTFLVPLAQDEQNYFAGLYILLTGGLLMLVVSCLGFCGSLRESQCMLVGFFSCMLVMIVAEIAAGFWLYTNSDRLEELVQASAVNTVKVEYGTKEFHTEVMDAIQTGLKCCGANGPSDWAGSKYYRRKDELTGIDLAVSGQASLYRVPKSCCQTPEDSGCEKDFEVGGLVSSIIYSDGCVNKLVDTLREHMNIAFGVGIAALILDLLGLIFSVILCCGIGSSDRYKA